MTTVTKFYLRYTSTVNRNKWVHNKDWDNAVEVQIYANTTEEAKTKLFKIIGKPPSNKEWKVFVDKIIQQPCEKDCWKPFIDDFPY